MERKEKNNENMTQASGHNNEQVLVKDTDTWSIGGLRILGGPNLLCYDSRGYVRIDGTGFGIISRFQIH